MRLGVVAKVVLALVVLLLAFAGNATFMLLSIHRARQGVVANEAYLELGSAVDSAWKSLNDFALALRMGRKHLDGALGAIDRYLEKEPGSPRRADFEARRGQIAGLAAELDAVSSELGASAVAVNPKARSEFESHFAMLTHSLNRMRRPLRGESGQIAQRLSDDEETALSMAVALGAAGLAVVGAAFIFTLRTLRPLGVLRARARQVAGGDYAQRTGVTSQDEIGDLARELDAMAAAIQEREQRLIRSEQLATVGRMAAQIAHEVRNPLAAIGLNAELLGDELGGDAEEGRRLIGSIIGEIDRLTEITETYLRFARLPRPKPDREDLGAIVASVVDLARGELAQDGIEVVVDAAPGLPEVAADEGQLRQALINLVRNAREAMREGAPAGAPKRLEIGVGLEGGRVVVRVRDHGPGIDKANLERIFDPFFSTKARGTGLGLALVQQIVVDHGGQIDVATAAGQGTTFSLAFPAATAEAPEGEPGAAEPSPTINPRSLAGGGAVSVGPAPIAQVPVQPGERQVQGGGIGGVEDQRALEGRGGGGRLAGSG
jgi:two-component system NtrC family sensor kinase